MNVNTETQFYVEGDESNWTFIDRDVWPSLDDNLIISNRGIAEAYQLIGLWDHSDLNQNMKILLDNFSILDTSNEALIKILSTTVGIGERIQHKNQNEINRINQNYWSNEESFIQVIFEVYYWKFPNSKVARKSKIDSTVIKQLMTSFKKNIKIIKRYNRRFLNKSLKIDDRKPKLIKEYWESNKFSTFTLNDVRLHLREAVGEQFDVSKSTLSRVLKKKAGMTYKKINKINTIVWTSESKWKMLEAAVLQLKLIQNETLMIYIDEFKYSSQNNNHHGWTLKGRNGYRKLFPWRFQASFMVAILIKKVEGITATTGTYNSEHFKYFLTKPIT